MEVCFFPITELVELFVLAPPVVDITDVLGALVVANGTNISIHHIDSILRDEVLG